MEDFGPVIWVFATLAALTYSGVSRAKKAARKGTAAPQGIPGEAWPQRTGLPKQQKNRPKTAQPAHSAHPMPATRPMLENGAYPASRRLAKTQFQEPQAAAPAYHTASARINSAPSTSKTAFPSNVSTAAAAPPTNSEIQSQIAFNEDFDLRQAIIMSEILHPKFDE